MRTSYSAIETYLQCPQRYKFQEIDRIRVPKSREAIFGTLIHNTLKFMFQREPLFPTLDEVINYFRENWPSRETLEAWSKNDPFKPVWSEEDEKTYMDEGVKMLKKFYEKNLPWNFIIVDLESRFEVPLQDEKTNETHILAGKIDRIDKLPDESYEIIDYKTAKRMPPQDSLQKNLQLSLYALGLRKRWPHIKIENIKVSLYFLKHGEKLTTHLTSENIENTQHEVLDKINEIQERSRQNKDFEPLPSAICDWCGYKPMCPAWKHLYKTNDKLQITNDKIDAVIKEYFDIRTAKKQNEDRLSELQKQIKDYMEQEKLTRVFGEDGSISKKTIQRYKYDFEKIKIFLSPIGKWEETLKLDELKLRKVLREIPESMRSTIEDSRSISKEYTVLTVSSKKNKKPE